MCNAMIHPNSPDQDYRLDDAQDKLRERAICMLLDESDAVAYTNEWLADDEVVGDLIHNIIGATTPQGIAHHVSQLQDAWARRNDAKIERKMAELGGAL